jgi:uncharacterized membrane protein
MKKSARKTTKKPTASSSSSIMRAKEQYSQELRSFIVHLILYLLVNFGLFTYLYSNNSDMTLFYWVAIGWGVGLGAHAMAVFGVMNYLHKEW